MNKSLHRGEREGFSFVSELGLFVADDFTLPPMLYRQSRLVLRERGARTLTPAEFWRYYDFCMKERPNILQQAKERGQFEYLDAVTYTSWEREGGGLCLIVHPEILSVKSEYKGGTVYRSVNPEGGEIPICERDDETSKQIGRFRREDVNPDTGLPRALGGEGEFAYIGNPYLTPSPVVISWGIEADLTICLSVTDSPFLVRECYE